VDIVELIKREHAKTNGLFDRLSETSPGAVKTRERLFEQLKTGLEVHGKVVQDLVYPVLRKQEDTRDLIPDIKDRNELKRHLGDLERTPKEDDDFLIKLKEFKKLVEQHLRTEQRQIFPAIKKAISGEEAEDLARRIAVETREVLEEAKQEKAAEAVPIQNGRARPESETESTSAAPRRAANEAERGAEVVSRSAQRVAEEGAETVRESAAAASAGARRLTETAARQLENTVRGVQGAAEIYGETNQRASEGIRSLMAIPTAAANAMQEIQKAWADWFTESMQRNARLTQELFRSSSAKDLAAVHREFLSDSFAQGLDRSARILRATQHASEEAIRPIEELREKTQQQQRRDSRKRRSEAA
jgi:hypothetical protein